MIKILQQIKKIYRAIHFFIQRRTRGWDDSDTWSLDYTISKFILPRLIRFKELNNGYPAEFNSEKEWNNILDKIINAFDLHIREINGDIEYSDSIIKDRDEGFELFRVYFTHLWW